MIHHPDRGRPVSRQSAIPNVWRRPGLTSRPAALATAVTTPLRKALSACSGPGSSGFSGRGNPWPGSSGKPCNGSSGTIQGGYTVPSATDRRQEMEDAFHADRNALDRVAWVLNRKVSGKPRAVQSATSARAADGGPRTPAGRPLPGCQRSRRSLRRGAQLRVGVDGSLHDVFWQRTKEIEEKGLESTEAESLCGVDADETGT